MWMQVNKKLRIAWTCFLLMAANLKFHAGKFVHVAFQIIKLPSAYYSSFQIAAPVVSSTFCAHALSGATTEVRSAKTNSIEIEAGEDFEFDFYIQGKTPTSFVVSELPEGLSKTLSRRQGSIAGAIKNSGSYTVTIQGYNSYYNAYTPDFVLSIEVTDSKPDPLTTLFSNEQLNSLGLNWYSSTWLGEFYSNNNSYWIYHKRLGWVFMDTSDGKNYWFFDENLGWLFVSSSIYPFFYSYEKSNWLYLFPETTDKRFWDYSSNSFLNFSQ